MIPRARRLPRAGFATLARAKRLSSPHFSISIAPAPRGGLAAVVPKKVAARSVDRHLLKRRIFSVISPYFLPHRVLVVHAKAGAAGIPFPSLRAELTALLDTLHKPV
jgi:RNase P protein component